MADSSGRNNDVTILELRIMMSEAGGRGYGMSILRTTEEPTPNYNFF